MTFPSDWEWKIVSQVTNSYFSKGLKPPTRKITYSKDKEVQEIHRNPNINELDYPSGITYIFTFPGLIVLFNVDRWIYMVGFCAIQYILLLVGFKI